MAQYTLTVKDHTRETSQSQMNVADGISAVARDALNTAIDAVIIGTIARDKLTATREQSAVIPTNPLAQREIKCLVGITDDVTGKPYTFTLPTWDLATNAPPVGSEYIDLALNANVIALVTEINANVQTPVGNPATVAYLKFVGRAS